MEAAYDQLIDLFSNRDALRTYIESYGSWGAVAYVIIQALQVIVAPIPGELTGALAGFIFGAWRGATLATIGLALGSGCAFQIGRHAGRPLVNRFVGEKTRDKFRFLTGRRGAVVLFLAFLIPGLPKDALTYLYSLGNIRFWPFMLCSQLGRIPGTIGLTLGADALYEEQWLVFAPIALGTLILIAGSYFYGDRLAAWLGEKKLASHKGGSDPIWGLTPLVAGC